MRVPKEQELRDAFGSRDSARLFHVLENIGPEDRSDTLLKLIVDHAWSTPDANVRNALVMALADLHAVNEAETIRHLLRQTNTKGARGTLLYALASMDEGVDPEIFMDTIVNDSMEAGEYLVDAIDEHRILNMNGAQAFKMAERLQFMSEKAENTERRALLLDAAERLSAFKD